MKYSIAILVCLLAGCTSPNEEMNDEFFTRHKEEQMKIDKCFSTGGMPIRSEWDGRLADCIYPPK